MSKKMKLPSIFKNRDPKHPWQWPSCNHPKTLSFRATNDAVFKTVNSVFLDSSDGLETPESWFTNSSSECASTFSEHSEENNNNSSNNNSSSNNNNSNINEAVEMIIRDVRSSERLFFEPGETSSIVKEAARLPFEESVALAMESDDPYADFRKSMQEMVESHGLEEWDRLEELLGWYLKMNGKHNHGFIVGAFVDVLLGLVKDSAASSMAACCSDATSYSSADSSFSSPSSPTGDADVAVKS